MFSVEWLSDLIDRLQAFLPQLVAAVLLLVTGLLVALFLRFLTRRLLRGVVDRAGQSATFRKAVSDPAIRSTIPRIVSGFVFWVTLLFFVSGAIESLGFTVVTDVLSQVAYYLPNLLAGIVIILVGVILARLVRSGATSAARSAGLLNAERVGQAGQLLLLVVAVVVALDQVGIDAQLLVVLLTVLTAASFGSAGLAFALGARATVGNIIASHYVTQAYRVGQTIRIGEIEGEIIQTTPTSVVVATPDGRMSIPARRFSEEPSLLVSQG